MVRFAFDPLFEKKFRKIKDYSLKLKIKAQIRKAIQTPDIGKPMRHNRRGTRELYIKPHRLSYMFLEKEGKILFLDVYHKDDQ